MNNNSKSNEAKKRAIELIENSDLSKERKEYYKSKTETLFFVKGELNDELKEIELEKLLRQLDGNGLL